MKRGTMFLLVLGLIVAGAIALGLIIKFENQSPTAQFKPDTPTILGLSNTFQLHLFDQGQGLKTVRVTINQGEEQKVLVDHRWPGRMLVAGSKVDQAGFKLSIPVKDLGLKDGPAVLSLLVRDHSWRESFHGNKLELNQEVRVDTSPPALSLATKANYLNLGGCGLVVFRANEEVETKVEVDSQNFSGLPLEGGQNLYHVLFAVPYDLPRDSKLWVKARDLAGNESAMHLPALIKPRRWRESKMNLSESFLEKILPEFRQHFPDLPADPVEAYLAVNREIRDKNNATIYQVTSVVSPVRMWSGPFIQLPNSARTASFADHRSYYYQGKEIDRQVHMGIDLASLANAEVPAANSGKVALAGYLGIYGNAVIIDHGQGLYSLYGHLSSLSVAKDQEVRKGQIIGQTGMSGLAGGDHLHFAMVCHGIYVNPVEWYDPRWIKHNVTDKEEAAVQEG